MSETEHSVVPTPPSPADASDANELLRSLYAELRRLAQRHMAGQRRDHTLQPTALVSEAFLRLGRRSDAWEGESHFLAVASRAMRQVLVDHARGRKAKKRAATGERCELESISVEYDKRSIDLLALDAALEQLESRDPVAARLVEMRYFGGQPMEECARLLGMSERQIYRRWQSTKALLHQLIERELGA